MVGMWARMWAASMVVTSVAWRGVKLVAALAARWAVWKELRMADYSVVPTAASTGHWSAERSAVWLAALSVVRSVDWTVEHWAVYLAAQRAAYWAD